MNDIFPINVVIAIATDTCTCGMLELQQFLSFLCRGSIMHHQYPRAITAGQKALLKQFPQLNDPILLAEVKCITQENSEEYIMRWALRYGAEFKVIPMTEEEYEVRDSLKEYQEGLVAAANKFDITSIVKK